MIEHSFCLVVGRVTHILYLLLQFSCFMSLPLANSKDSCQETPTQILISQKQTNEITAMYCDREVLQLTHNWVSFNFNYTKNTNCYLLYPKRTLRNMAKVYPCYLSLDICSNTKKLSRFLKEVKKRKERKTWFNKKNKAVNTVNSPKQASPQKVFTALSLSSKG